MKNLLCLLFSCSIFASYAQPNCEAFKYYFKDTLKYEACLKAEEVEGYYQFSKAYQRILDESIKIDPTFAYAYRRKSVAYLKSGDFITWKNLMDKAVELNPQENLGHRGYIRFLCFRDYEGAISDFDKLDSLGFASDHYGMAKALCYKLMGKKEKAIEILEVAMKSDNHENGLNDYLHLGVLYLEQEDYQKAIDALLVQSEVNNQAENQYYIALAYKALKAKSKYLMHLKNAKELYLNERRMFQTYIDPIDKVYLDDIEGELAASVVF